MWNRADPLQSGPILMRKVWAYVTIRVDVFARHTTSPDDKPDFYDQVLSRS